MASKFVQQMWEERQVPGARPVCRVSVTVSNIRVRVAAELELGFGLGLGS